MRSTALRHGLVLTIVLLLLPPPAAGAAGWDEADAVVPHARDVFVIVGSALRNPDAETDPSAHLFNVAGVSMDLTWGEWQQAAATSSAHQTGGGSPRTDVRLTLSGLIPAGVYSLFYVTLGPDSENPLCPGVERGLPLTAQKAARQVPDAASFVAGIDGTASFRGRVDGALLDAHELYIFVIYHLDGRTYGSLPNRGEFLTQGESCRSSFGEDAMRQAVIVQKFG